MLTKQNPVESPGPTTEQAPPRFQGSEVPASEDHGSEVQKSDPQESTSTSVAALSPEEQLSPLAQEMHRRIVFLHALYKSTELKVLDDAHTVLGIILTISAAFWAGCISKRRRKQNLIYLWVIACAIALGLAVELSLQLSTLFN
jgi:hypothetical protein